MELSLNLPKSSESWLLPKHSFSMLSGLNRGYLKARIEEFSALAGHEHVHKGMTSRDLTENVEQPYTVTVPYTETRKATRPVYSTVTENVEQTYTVNVPYTETRKATRPVYSTVTSYRVTPVVALVQPGFTLTLDEFEVDEAFEVPLQFLMTPAHHRRHEFEALGQRRQFLSMPWRGQLPDGTPRD